MDKKMVEKMEKEKRLLLIRGLHICAIPFFFFITLLLMRDTCMAETKQYSVNKRDDGGYTLSISYSKRIWKPITAEGIFPKEEGNYELNLIGAGEDWSKEGEPGFFYSLEKIESKKTHWEVGFAWVNKDRSVVYLNLFWVSPPNKLMPMVINGEYNIDR
jgi:hypothetical protein